MVLAEIDRLSLAGLEVVVDLVLVVAAAVVCRGDETAVFVCVCGCGESGLTIEGDGSFRPS